MNAVRLTSFLLICAIAIYGVSQAQVLGRTVRTYMPPPLEPCYPSYGSSDDLSLLLSLARLLEKSDCDSSKSNYRQKDDNNDINAGAIIDKLINALVYATTQNTCNSNGNGGNGSSSGDDGLLGSLLGGLLGANSSTNNRKPDNSLVDLSLLGRDDLLKLALGGQDALQVGLGSDNGSDNSTSGTGGGVAGVLDSVL